MPSMIQKVSPLANIPLLEDMKHNSRLFFCCLFVCLFKVNKAVSRYCYLLHHSQNKLHNTKCLTPSEKMTGTKTFISISSQTANKGPILQISLHPSEMVSHYLPQQIQLLAQHGCFRYKYLYDNETA